MRAPPAFSECHCNLCRTSHRPNKVILVDCPARSTLSPIATASSPSWVRIRARAIHASSLRRKEPLALIRKIIPGTRRINTTSTHAYHISSTRFPCECLTRSVGRQPIQRAIRKAKPNAIPPTGEDRAARDAAVLERSRAAKSATTPRHSAETLICFDLIHWITLSALK